LTAGQPRRQIRLSTILAGCLPGLAAKKYELRLRSLNVRLSFIKYHLRAEVLAAFDLSQRRHLLESGTPDAPSVFDSADALAALCRTRGIGFEIAFHQRSLSGCYFRVAKRRVAVCAGKEAPRISLWLASRKNLGRGNRIAYNYPKMNYMTLP